MDEPVQPELQWPAAQLLGAADTKWSPYRGKTHMPCAICQLVIHERGVGNAPYPAPATRRRKGPGGGLLPADAFLCYRHGAVLEERDKAVHTRVAEMRAHAAHLARSRR